MRRACAVLAVVEMITACGGSSGSASPAPDAATAADAQVVQMGPADASLDAQSADAGLPSGDAATVADTAAPIAQVTPVLESALVRQTGRFGDDLRIDVTGSDRDGDTIAVRVELSADNNTPLTIADNTGDGMPDPGPADVPLSGALPAADHATAFAVLAKFYTLHPEAKHAKVSLLDAHGNVSNTVTADVGVQPVVQLDGACDVSSLTNRCAVSLGCKGALPSVCKEGEAPAITRAGYYSDELGDRVLIEGMDADEDVTGYTVEFLSAQGAPVSILLNGQDDPPASSFSKTNVDVVFDAGKFFLLFEPGPSFIEMVKQVRLTVTDSGGHQSAAMTKTLNDGLAGAPTRTSGQSCDARRFDRCATNNVCSRSSPTALTGTCRDLLTARASACTAALTLAPFQGITEVRGRIGDPSLWDVPAPGCSSNNPTNHPDAVVKVTLTKPVRQLVISSDNAYTGFDTTLYALASCTSAPTVAWCADDQANTAPRSQLAVLTLTNLPAQDIYVVVDSFNAGTGPMFQLNASVLE